MSGDWNRSRYTLWAPFYDLLVGFGRQRRASVDSLGLVAGERVLLVGVGTGLDLPLLPSGVVATGIDLTPAMLARARRRAAPSTELRVMDAQDLAFPDESFDAAILHLILAVVPEPTRCLAETARVVRPGGRIAVFDKFLADDRSPSLLRRLANGPASFLATDLNRRFGEILCAATLPLVVESDVATLGNGWFRRLLLRRVAQGPD